MSANLTDTATNTRLSDYEKLRAANIEKHNAQLRALGLISAKEERESNALAWQQEPIIASPPKRKRVDSGSEPVKARKISSRPSRKSLRLEGKEPDGSDVPPPISHEERELRVRECRRVRLERARQFYADNGGKKVANPTATYDHTAMRIRTMTLAGLGGRIKAIERAAGKHCIIKMAIFKSCLQDFGMWELAELAGEALERLKDLKATEDLGKKKREGNAAKKK